MPSIHAELARVRVQVENLYRARAGNAHSGVFTHLQEVQYSDLVHHGRKLLLRLANA